MSLASAIPIRKVFSTTSINEDILRKGHPIGDELRKYVKDLELVEIDIGFSIIATGYNGTVMLNNHTVNALLDSSVLDCTPIRTYKSIKFSVPITNAYISIDIK